MQNKIPFFSPLVIFLLLFSATQVNAAIYKCPGKNGEALYQEKPCKKGQEVVVNVREPTALEKHRAKARAGLNELQMIGVTAKLKSESQQRDANNYAANQRCQGAKDDIQYWETQSRHNYTKIGHEYDLERVEQAKEKAREVCPAWEIK